MDLHLMDHSVWTRKTLPASLASTLAHCIFTTLHRAYIRLIWCWQPVLSRSGAILPRKLNQFSHHRDSTGKSMDQAACWYGRRVSVCFWVMMDAFPKLWNRLGKPEVISAIGIVTRDTFKNFIPFNSSTRMPPGLSCGKSFLLLLGQLLTISKSGGVENEQKDDAFLSWSAGTFITI